MPPTFYVRLDMDPALVEELTEVDKGVVMNEIKHNVAGVQDVREFDPVAIPLAILEAVDEDEC